MAVLGIVSEYNPFHTGHGYQIAQAQAQLGSPSPTVAVMSGNWVQRGDCAISDKWTRASLALSGGADLVLELPTLWALSSAESFAWGGVSLLHAAGVVDVLSFGSECGTVAPLQQVAACLDSPAYEAGLRRFLDEGMPFAACRQAVIRGLLGNEPAELLSTPNNNLGVEYIRALNRLHSPITPSTVRRVGAAHGSLSPAGQRPQFVSAAQLRRDLQTGKQEAAQDYLPQDGLTLLGASTAGFPSLIRVERAILARLRTMTANQWAQLPDSGAAEGLTRRLEQAGHQAASLEEFFTLAKTRRYPLSRLRRLVLWAFLGLEAQDRPERPPYLRVLGFNSRGQALLREMKTRAALPILIKPTQARDLPEPARRVFELEARCTDLYGLCFQSPWPAGCEWSRSPVRIP